MTLEEQVRAEFRAVAEQVAVPPMPPLEQSRRPWQVVLTAAAAIVLVVGGLSLLQRDEGADSDPRPVETPTPTIIETTAPTIPWLDDERLFVDGRQVPGRWVELVAAGDAWVARRSDLHVFWGRGSQRHDLGFAGATYGSGRDRYAYPLGTDGPFLSPYGRYLAYAAVSPAGDTVLVEVATGRSSTIEIPRETLGDAGLVGVTDDGQLLTIRYAETSQGSAPVESLILRPGRAPVRLDTEGGHLRAANGSPGHVLEGVDGRLWLVDIEGDRLHRVLELGRDMGDRSAASVSPFRGWLLDLAWAVDEDEPTSISVTDIGTGRRSALAAPEGWVFAPLLAPGFWEPRETLVLFVVDPESRDYRAARCAPELGRCALLEEP